MKNIISITPNNPGENDIYISFPSFLSEYLSPLIRFFSVFSNYTIVARASDYIILSPTDDALIQSDAELRTAISDFLLHYGNAAINPFNV
jgi:hypothetical protein